MKEKLLESKIKFSGNIMDVSVDRIILPDGSESRREIVHHPGGMTVIPHLHSGKIVMIEQYRHAAGEVLLELPAGRAEPGEELKKGAARELKEETGYNAGKITHIIDFYTTPGYSTECLGLFLAEDLHRGKQELEKGEFLRIREIDTEEILELIFKGKIRDGKSALGLLTFKMLQQERG